MKRHDGMELDRDPRDFYLEDDFLRGRVLNTKEMSMKFDKNIVITNKFMNGKEALANGRNMKYIFKSKRMHRTS
jgi:hypothetical protein